MNVLQPSPDRVLEMRRHIGFPKNAGAFMRLVFFLALPSMIFLRYEIGVRVVSGTRLFKLLLFALLWNLVLSLVLARDNIDEFPVIFSGAFASSVALVAIGFGARLMRWYRRQQGEQLHTLSLGISKTFRWVANGNGERYLDPIAGMLGGVAILAWQADIYQLGLLLILSSWCLLVVEKYVHEIQLSQQDDLLAAEAHEQNTALYLQRTIGTPLQATPPATPLATGVDSLLAKNIAQRADQPNEEINNPQQAPQASRSPTSQITEARPHAPMHWSEQQLTFGKVVAIMAVAIGAFVLVQLVVDSAGASTRRASASGTSLSQSTTGPQGTVGLQRVATATAGQTPAAPVQAATPPAMTANEIAAEADRLYRGKNGQEGDEAAAAPLFLACARAGNAHCQMMISTYYFSGKSGMPKDERQGLAYLEASAAQDYPFAEFLLGMLYKRGLRGAPYAPAKAAQLFQRAAEQGEALAQYELGWAYLQGDLGLPKDLNKAMRLIKQAANGGSEEAKEALEIMKKLARQGDFNAAAALNQHGIPWQ